MIPWSGFSCMLFRKVYTSVAACLYVPSDNSVLLIGDETERDFDAGWRLGKHFTGHIKEC